ncbi:hypothetical protein K466DRAFT_466253, partial [Polyporus arcularius HHB13444]
NSSGAETVQEMEGAELMTSLKQASESVYCKLMRAKSKETWIQGEKELRGTRIGRAARTERDHRWKAKNDDVEKAVIRDSDEAQRFQAFFQQTHPSSSPSPPEPRDPSVQAQTAAVTARQESDTAFVRSQ